MNTELTIKKLNRKNYIVSNDKYFLHFINVSCLLAKIKETTKESKQYYEFACPNKKKAFMVYAENKREAVAEMFRLLHDSNLMKRFNGTVFQMI
ncbi:hypothetical protein D9V86_08965 [Bacteroidetes/Chlorobi group bacterium ChocPot_Mid]|nr:MAG: hypothetical protein D9V86_08965 [Bacteroidetes/Chlorobi group bacterium ChocPot_Mid]